MEGLDFFPAVILHNSVRVRRFIRDGCSRNESTTLNMPNKNHNSLRIFFGPDAATAAGAGSEKISKK